MADNDARAFPRLTQQQVERIAAQGRVRATSTGELLVRAGDRAPGFFVVLAGLVEITRPDASEDTLIVTFEAGQFSGEMNLLSGRRSLVQARVVQAGEVIELDREHLLELVQRDPEIGEILMRAFILRRVLLIARGLGDVVLLGSLYCAGTLRVREFLTRNGQPYSFVDLDRDGDVQELLDRFHVTHADVPVLICRGERVLRSPTDAQIADCLGLNDPIAIDHTLDVAVIGAGPAGLSAAVYAASEGLDVLRSRRVRRAAGGIEPRIGNYLDSPRASVVGVADARSARPTSSAQTADRANGGAPRRSQRPYTVRLDDEGNSIRANTIVIATGGISQTAARTLARFEGVGVYCQTRSWRRSSVRTKKSS
jgi:thioredoxin reductase (NADPH)